MLRQTVVEKFDDLASEAVLKTHERNYHRLHIWRDGTTTWNEDVNQSSDLIDRQADHFAPVKSLVQVGTGGYLCNCDWCSDPECSAADIEITSEEHTEMTTRMEDELGRIPVGYFDDEDAVA